MLILRYVDILFAVLKDIDPMYNVSRSQFTGPGSGASLVQVAQLVCQHQSFGLICLVQ